MYLTYVEYVSNICFKKAWVQKECHDFQKENCKWVVKKKFYFLLMIKSLLVKYNQILFQLFITTINKVS